MPACNLTSVLKNTQNSCGNFTPSGVSDRVYLFDIDEVFGSGADASYPVPGDNGFVPAGSVKTTDCYALDIKTDSGQVTSEKGEDNISRSLVFTGIVDHNIKDFLGLDAALGFGMNVGVIVPIDNEKSYIIYSPYRATKYSSNYDSGTTYDSDHGFTITFTAAPVLFGCPMIALGRAALNNSAHKTFTPYSESASDYSSGSGNGISLSPTSLTLSKGTDLAAGKTITVTKPDSASITTCYVSNGDSSKISITSSGSTITVKPVDVTDNPLTVTVVINNGTSVYYKTFSVSVTA